MSTEVQCCGRVWKQYHWVGCPKKGKVERDGKSYCGIHDPVAIQARTDKRDAERLACRQADEIRYLKARQVRERAELCVAACDWMTDEEVKMMAVMSRTALVALLYNKA